MKDMILELNFSIDSPGLKKTRLDDVIKYCNRRFIIKSKDGRSRWLIVSEATLLYKQQKVEEVEGVDGNARIWVDVDRTPIPCPDIVISWLYYYIGNRLNWDAWESLSREQKSTYFNDQMQQE